METPEKLVPFCDVPSCVLHKCEVKPSDQTLYIAVRVSMSGVTEQYTMRKYVFGLMHWRVCNKHAEFKPGHPAPDWLVELMTGCVGPIV